MTRCGGVSAKSQQFVAKGGIAGLLVMPLQRLFKSPAARHACLSAQRDSDLSVGKRCGRRFLEGMKLDKKPVRLYRRSCWTPCYDA